MPPKRTPITSLSPLTQKQIDYLTEQGRSAGGLRGGGYRAWWMVYFQTEDENAFNDPGADVSNPHRFRVFADSLRNDLQAARTNKKLWNELISEGRLPPDPTRGRPYELPEYFSWWQAENAFRRGYMEATEAEARDEIVALLKREARGGAVTPEGFRAVADVFEKDVVVATFFNELADGLEDGTAKNYSSVKDLLQDLRAIRGPAYQQFDPRFRHLRWAPGAGLVGLPRKR